MFKSPGNRKDLFLIEIVWNILKKLNTWKNTEKNLIIKSINPILDIKSYRLQN